MTRSNNSRRGIVRHENKSLWKSLGHHSRRAFVRASFGEAIKYDSYCGGGGGGSGGGGGYSSSVFVVDEIKSFYVPSKTECSNIGYAPQDT
ncbi:hypothetical protein FDP41_004072 [Naegleria fowleri]|uniref:Uncharacterized protein n=1 Tax=Naegleria fowleri TaxID=5763 RepID=A0A6A5BII9_NAEFO|nr:uncharacterized protein FDP41_004072 [Naegleria fowleri]KAF0976777.1 hypothetical protein FDP41_004072 [Naegleria fowleri]